jgi:LysM repeat protein
MTGQGSQQLPADENSRLSAVPVPASPPQLSLSEGAVTLKSEVPLNVTATARQQIPMITQVTVGEATQPDPNRPSLILQRAEGDSLWQIARENGSTMDAIRRANGITDDPLPGQMLLIPIA